MHVLTDGPARAERKFVFAHGAGGAMDTPFMNDVATAMGARGIRVIRFEFPYMAMRRTGGKRGAPDRQPVLLQTWRDVVAEHRGKTPFFIGGKSMGGRMASMVADELRVDGLVCFGYPFHPPGAPEKLRTEHLATLTTPTLIIQGERDAFGPREEVAGYRLSPSIAIEWMPGGDHSFKPGRGSGTSYAENVHLAAEKAADFIFHRGKLKPG